MLITYPKIVAMFFYFDKILQSDFVLRQLRFLLRLYWLFRHTFFLEKLTYLFNC